MGIEHPFTFRSSGIAGKKTGHWLPESMPFLSGLPESARRRRLLVPMQAFADESGSPGSGRHFSMVGLVGHSQDWAAFSDEWANCLRYPRRILRFKMKEAVGLTGEFHKWTAVERDRKLFDLVRIINRYVQLLTYTVIDMEAHAETWAKLDKPRNEVYFWPFQNTISATCFSLWDAGWRERFEIIFDEQVIFGPRAKAWYPLMKAIIEHREPESSAILPVEPMFKSDDEFLPIQAADLCAYLFRRCADDPSYREFDWLRGEMRDVKESDYTQYYDRERMVDVMNQTNQIVKEGKHIPHLEAIYREVSKRK